MIKEGMLWLVFGRLLSIVYSIGSIKVITSVLSQVEVGNYFLINTYIMWFAFALVSPVGTYYNRHVHTWDDQGILQASFRALNKYLILASLAVIPLLYALKSLFNVAAALPVLSLILVVSSSTYICSWFQTLCPTLNLLGKRKVFIFYTALSQVIGLLSAVLFIFMFKPLAVNWHYGILLGQLVAGIASWRFFKAHIFTSNLSVPSKSFFTRELFNFSFPVMISTLLLWAQTQGYRIFFEVTAGVEALAYLGVGLSLASSAAVVIETITTQFLYPDFFLGIKSESHHARQLAWERLWRRAASFYIPSLLFIACSAELWVVLLTSPTYHTVAWLLKWGALIEMFRMMTGVLYLISHSEKNTARAILPYLSGTALVVLGLYFYSSHGTEILLSKTPLVLAAAGLFTFLMAYFSMRSLMRFSLNAPYLFKVFLFSSPMVLALLFNFQLDFLGRIVLTIALGVYTLGLIRYCTKDD